MNTPKMSVNIRQQTCKFVGCSNTFVGPPQQKYCTDPRCGEARRIMAQKKRKPRVDSSADNLELVRGKFPRGTILRIQCAASGPTGRCPHKFTVAYDPTRQVYPKYCERHRNAYQRARFQGKV